MCDAARELTEDDARGEGRAKKEAPKKDTKDMGLANGAAGGSYAAGDA